MTANGLTIPISTSWQYMPQDNLVFILRKTDNRFFYLEHAAADLWFKVLETGQEDTLSKDERSFLARLIREGLLEYV